MYEIICVYVMTLYKVKQCVHVIVVMRVDVKLFCFFMIVIVLMKLFN